MQIWNYQAIVISVHDAGINHLFDKAVQVSHNPVACRSPVSQCPPRYRVRFLIWPKADCKLVLVWIYGNMSELSREAASTVHCHWEMVTSGVEDRKLALSGIVCGSRAWRQEWGLYWFFLGRSYKFKIFLNEEEILRQDWSLRGNVGRA